MKTEKKFDASTINSYARICHKANKKWWTDLETGERIERNRGELLILIVSEMTEALEGIRKNIMDNHLPHRKMEEVEMADALIRSFDFLGGFDYQVLDSDIQGSIELISEMRVLLEEGSPKGDLIMSIVTCISECYLAPPKTSWERRSMVNFIMMVIYYCGIYELDLWGAFEEKIKYNKTRLDHKVESRKLQCGKKF